jgi:hypothetical protein
MSSAAGTTPTPLTEELTIWLSAQFSLNDVATLTAAFVTQSILSVSDVMLLTAEDLNAMGLTIGLRNRVLLATCALKPVRRRPPNGMLDPALEGDSVRLY